MQQINCIENDSVLNIGKKFFRHIRMVEGGTYRISKNIKGSHKERVIIGQIKVKKINLLVDSLLTIGATDKVKSMTTNTVYLTYNNKKLRISDHNKNSFEGLNVLVFWNSNIDELLKQIKDYATY